MLHTTRHFTIYALLNLLMTTCLWSFTTYAQSPTGFLPNQLLLPKQSHQLNWHWLGDTVNNKWEPHAAILMPVTLPSCPKLFYMQFDLGATTSIFYSQPLEQIRAKYPKAFAGQDSISKLTHFHFKADGMKIQAKEIAMVAQTFQPAAINWADKNSITIIGTLGTDFIENKIVAIDYVNTHLYIGDTLPAAWTASLVLSDFYFARRSVLLPATIAGKNILLFFDTGSSAYTLLTDKTTSQTLATANSTWQTYPSRSWDRVLTAITAPTTATITIASQVLPLHYVTYVEGASSQQIEQMMKLGIGGLTGNKLFLNSVLVLDTKAKKFGLVSGKEKKNEPSTKHQVQESNE